MKTQVGLWIFLRRKGNNDSTARTYMQINMFAYQGVLVLPAPISLLYEIDLSYMVRLTILLTLAFIIDGFNSRYIKSLNLAETLDIYSEKANELVFYYNMSIPIFLFSSVTVWYFSITYLF